MRVRVFENRELRRIFGPKGDEATGGCKNLHNEEHQKFYFSLNTTRMIKFRMRWSGHVARIGVKRNAYRALVGRSG
jgi:hypothetical protein